MGADLILAVATMPKTVGGGMDTDAWKTAYHLAINSLSDEQALNLYGEAHGEVPEETHDENPTRTQAWLPAKVARESFRPLVDYIDADYRDCGLYKVGGRWALITGGMSWGDSPSDSFDDVNILSSIWWAVHGE